MKGLFYKAGAIAAGLLIVLLGFALIVYCVGTDKQVYYAENVKLATAHRTGMSEEDLAFVTDAVVEYLQGEGDLDISVRMAGVQRSVFNQKELSHMVDVQALFLALHQGIWLSGGVLAVLLAAYGVVFKKKAGAKLCGCFLAVVISVVALAVALGIWATIDFTTFWDTFHEIFFTNDLWQLNPQTDVLIQIMPEQFFVDFATRIVLWFAGFLAVGSAVALVCRRKFFARKRFGAGGE